MHRMSAFGRKWLEKAQFPIDKRFEDQKGTKFTTGTTDSTAWKPTARNRPIVTAERNQNTRNWATETRAGQSTTRNTLWSTQQISKNSVLIEQQAQSRRVTKRDITLWLRNIIHVYEGIPKENVPQRVASQILKDNMNLEWIPKYQKKKIIDKDQKRQMNSELE